MSDEAEGVFVKPCASHVATLVLVLHVSSGRIFGVPLMYVMSRWKLMHDKALSRLLAYLKQLIWADVVGDLMPSDRDSTIVRIYTDSGWHGEGETTLSTSRVFGRHPGTFHVVRVLGEQHPGYLCGEAQVFQEVEIDDEGTES